MMRRLNAFYILATLFVFLMILKCQMKTPSELEQQTRVTLNFKIAETGQSDNAFRGGENPESSTSERRLPKTDAVLTADEVKVVFYDFEADLETIVHLYNERYNELEALWSSFPGSQTDFEQYWIARDQAEFNIVSAGDYWLEKRANLTVSGNQATGEIELSEGAKTFTIGIFEQGQLTHVGYPSENSGFFQVIGEENTIVTATLFEVTAPTPAPPDTGQTGTMTDIDGNIYQTVKIGNQWWMAENLKVTHYRNGDAIPNVTGDTEWTNLTTGAYCAYENNENNVDTYGYLYNWYAVDDRRQIAPSGWHVPTDDEWKELEMYLGMSQSEADISGDYRGTNEGSKLAGRADLWDDGNLESNAVFDESGFSALPAGSREGGNFKYYLGYAALFWSGTESSNSNSESWYRCLIYSSSQVLRSDFIKRDGFSVRLVRD